MYLYGLAAGGGGGQAPQSPSLIGALFPFILIFVIFYFIIIMPARKKQKHHQSLVSGLQGGERVVTSGGIYGTVTRVLEDRFEIEVDKGTKLQIAKGSVSGVIQPDSGKQK
jgi:preprotein translocase subunit YajC